LENERIFLSQIKCKHEQRKGQAKKEKILKIYIYGIHFAPLFGAKEEDEANLPTFIPDRGEKKVLQIEEPSNESEKVIEIKQKTAIQLGNKKTHVIIVIDQSGSMGDKSTQEGKLFKKKKYK